MPDGTSTASETTSSAATRREIRPRSPEFDFSAVPRFWFGGNPLATHLVNGVNLLFPAGERFFVRSVKHYLDRIDDEALRAQVRGFFGQEGRHAQSHERFFAAMESQGYEIAEFLRVYQRIAYQVIEPRTPHALRLAVTAALEHYTALLAEGVFTDDVLQLADPQMRELLLWHAAEEIEHKAVAFDVLQRVAPGYPVRMAGMALATLGLVVCWVLATRMLHAQDRRAGRRITRESVAQMRERPRSVVRDVFVRGLLQYLRPGFHPLQNDNLHLAEAYLARAGM